MKAVLRIAMLALFSTKAWAGSVGTCDLQANCFALSFTKAAVTSTTACKTGASCQWKVCLTINTNSPCAKGTGESLSHSCVKAGADTICRDESNKNFTGGVSRDPVVTDFKQCQTGLPGATLYFLLKDGNGCDASTSKAYALPSLVSGATAACQPRPESIASCTGNAPGEECVWSVTLPMCGDATASNSSSTSGNTAIGSQTVVNTQEGGSTTSTTTTAASSCLTQQQALPQTLLKYDSGVAPSCPIESAQAVLGDCCQCTRPSTDCQYLTCQQTIPPAKLMELQGMGSTGTCP